MNPFERTTSTSDIPFDSSRVFRAQLSLTLNAAQARQQICIVHTPILVHRPESFLALYISLAVPLAIRADPSGNMLVQAMNRVRTNRRY